jgi:hypothetical protein
MKVTLVAQSRVSFKTSFNSKQPKLETKLVSALSETKCLFWLFHFYTKTESFDISVEPKQTEEYIWVFSENLGLFRFVSLCSKTDLFVSVVSI